MLERPRSLYISILGKGRGKGTGTWFSAEPQMTLTYRGQKYDQQKVTGAFDKSSLYYRGVSYTK